MTSACWFFPFSYPTLQDHLVYTSHWSPKLVGIFWYSSGSKHAVATCLLMHACSSSVYHQNQIPVCHHGHLSLVSNINHRLICQIPTEPENSCPTCHGMIYTNLAHGGSNSTPKIPEFWKVPPVEPGRPLSYLAATLWRFLCIISIFRPDLEEHWVSKQDPRGWKIQEDRMVSRLSNSNTTVRPLFTHLPCILIIIHSCRPV